MNEIVQKIFKLDIQDLISIKNVVENRIQILQSGGVIIEKSFTVEEVEEKIQVEDIINEELQEFQQIILTDLE